MSLQAFLRDKGAFFSFFVSFKSLNISPELRLSIVIRSLLFLVIALSLSATGALGRNQYEVLFIWDGEEQFVPSDNALRDYLVDELGYYVEYFDDDELEEDDDDELDEDEEDAPASATTILSIWSPAVLEEPIYPRNLISLVSAPVFKVMVSSS